jgi:hypothetical protein
LSVVASPSARRQVAASAFDTIAIVEPTRATTALPSGLSSPDEADQHERPGGVDLMIGVGLHHNGSTLPPRSAGPLANAQCAGERHFELSAVVRMPTRR